MIDWPRIDTVLLDMDGTLLDLYFDNHFWLEYLPERFAQARDITIADAKAQLMQDFGRHQGTLNWYCLDFWSAALGLDVVALKHDVRHRISPRPNAFRFLQAIRESGRRAILCTNAHRASVTLKLEQTGLDLHLDGVVSSHDFRLPKEDVRFWEALRQHLGHDPLRTLLVDDNAAVLASAREAGIGHLAGIALPDSQRPPLVLEDFFTIDSFLDVLPPPTGAGGVPGQDHRDD